MKIIVEFESMDEFENFRVSGRKTRGKSQMTEVEETATEPTRQAAKPDPEQTAQAIRDAQPVQTFTPPPSNVHSFPGGNGQTPSPGAAHPLVAAILARIDGAVSSGQTSDAIVNWFRQQIGPEAAQATLDQIKQIFVPRMTEAQLKQIAPQLGIQA